MAPSKQIMPNADEKAEELTDDSVLARVLNGEMQMAGKLLGVAEFIEANAGLASDKSGKINVAFLRERAVVHFRNMETTLQEARTLHQQASGGPRLVASKA